MGASDQNDNYVKQTAFEYTSTRSIFTMSVGGSVQMKITFLSPVTPDELLRSSLPYSYMDYTPISRQSGFRETTAPTRNGIMESFEMTRSQLSIRAGGRA